MSTAEAPAETAIDQQPRLIFDWRRRNIGRLRLPAFLLLSAAGHAAFFYLFKVVTPSDVQHLPPQHEVTFLTGSDPATADILTKLEDRSPAVLAVTDRSNSDAEELRRAVPQYVPHFASYTPRIHETPAARERPLPGLAEASQPVLPALPPRATPALTPARPDAAPAKPRFTIYPPFTNRELLAAPAWPADLTAPEDPDTVYHFHLAVEASGAVKYCFTDGAAAPESLRAAVSRMRFSPTADNSLQWTEAEVHW